MTAALADAQMYGPQTDAIAREVAARFNGCVTDINYKTRESATRKCITDNSRPYDLKDLARTTIVAGWDSTEIKFRMFRRYRKIEVDSRISAAEDRGQNTVFGDYAAKHTSFISFYLLLTPSIFKASGACES